jgi:Dyp-type peroxidase family
LPRASKARRRAAVSPAAARALVASAATDEPLLEVDDIQGNILAGFNKDHQLLVALRVHDRAAAKAWLSRVEPFIATLGEVGQFNRLFRAKRRRLGHDPIGLIATWANIAFSHDGLAKLMSPADADGISDDGFKQGLPARAATLGDTPDTPGQEVSAHWVVGSLGNVPDILLIVASDHPDQLERMVAHICPGAGDLPGAPEAIWKELGETRSDMPGHEHFGFKDGVSQPGVRGLISRAPDVPLTERLLLDPPDGQVAFSAPGTPLVWPGQFVFGYPSSDRKTGEPVPPPPGPPWLRNGSLLVFRRLRQNVAAFHAFLRAGAGTLAATQDFPGLTAERLGALLVGRWPSGAPVERSPAEDNEALAGDPLSVNDFAFAADTPAPAFRPGAGPDEAFPRAAADPQGFVCPCAAHIRKVNPRDQDSDKGDAFDTLTRRIIRRGIPFGPPLPVPPGGRLPQDDGVDRGLHFLCYQTQIVEQFELLQTDWANSTNNPKPNGHDLIIGQSMDGNREVELVTAAGGDQTLRTDRVFVTMTGGGYFFAPGIAALTMLAQAPPAAMAAGPEPAALAVPAPAPSPRPGAAPRAAPRKPKKSRTARKGAAKKPVNGRKGSKRSTSKRKRAPRGDGAQTKK